MKRTQWILACLLTLAATAQAQSGGALIITSNAAARMSIDNGAAIDLPSDFTLAQPILTGKHHIALTSKRGGFRWERDVEVAVGERVELKAKLAPANVWYDGSGHAWALSDNGHTVGLEEAADYCANLRIDDAEHWRLPFFDEVLKSYDIDAMRSLGGVNLSTGYIWTLDHGCDNVVAPSSGCTPRSPVRAACIHEEHPERNSAPVYVAQTSAEAAPELPEAQRRRFRMDAATEDLAQQPGVLRATSRQVLMTLRAHHRGEDSMRADLKPSDIEIYSDDEAVRIEYLRRIQTPVIRIEPDTWLFKPSGRGVWVYSLPGQGMTEDYYLVGFTPPSSPEGQCHKLRAVVGSDIVVYSPTEYCYARGVDPLQGTKLGDELTDRAKGSDNGQLPLSISANAFYSAPGRAQLQITAEFLRESILHRRAKNGAYNVRAHLVGLLMNADNQVVSRFSDNFFTQYFTDGFHNSKWSPFAFSTELSAPPGDYTLRVAIGDEKNFGAARMPVHIPAYDGHVLEISAPALSRYIRALEDMKTDMPQLPQLNPTPLVSNGMQVIPTAQFSFHHNETLFLYFEMYEPLLRNAEGAQIKVGFRMRVISVKDGKLAMETNDDNVREEIHPGEIVIAVGKQVEIDRLPYGEYRLEIEAVDSAGQKTAARSSNFRVVAN